MPMPANVKKYKDKYWDIYQVGTLPPSGALGMNQIQGEFGRGNSLGNYSGTQWWTDTYGQTGTFTNPLGFNQFYSKRGSSPPPPYHFNSTLTTGNTSSTSGSTTYYYIGYDNGGYGIAAIGSFSNNRFIDGTVMLRFFSRLKRFGTSATYSFYFLRSGNFDAWEYVEIVGRVRYTRGQMTRQSDGSYIVTTDGGVMATGTNYNIIIG